MFPVRSGQELKGTLKTQRMRKTPLHSQTWRIVRCLTVLAVGFALIVTPFIVTLTHGPLAQAAGMPTASNATVEIAVEHQKHGVEYVAKRSQDSGHSHGHFHAHADVDNDERQTPPASSHNAADHDHQFQGLVGQTAGVISPLPTAASSSDNDTFRNLTLESPRRPPRVV